MVWIWTSSSSSYTRCLFYFTLICPHTFIFSLYLSCIFSLYLSVIILLCTYDNLWDCMYTIAHACLYNSTVKVAKIKIIIIKVYILWPIGLLPFAIIKDWIFNFSGIPNVWGWVNFTWLVGLPIGLHFHCSQILYHHMRWSEAWYQKRSSCLRCLHTTSHLSLHCWLGMLCNVFISILNI